MIAISKIYIKKNSSLIPERITLESFFFFVNNITWSLYSAFWSIDSYKLVEKTNKHTVPKKNMYSIQFLNKWLYKLVLSSESKSYGITRWIAELMNLRFFFSESKIYRESCRVGMNDSYELVVFSEWKTYNTIIVVWFLNKWLLWACSFLVNQTHTEQPA